MKKFWKVLGTAALVAGLTPYKIETDSETDTKTVQALLWKVVRSPRGDGKNQYAIDIGLILPGKEKAEEKDLFVSDADEVTEPSAEAAVSMTDEPDPEEPVSFEEAPVFAD